MREVRRSALVPFPAAAMFDLVNDVAAYPDFLPWCSGSEVKEQSADHMIARVDVAKGGIHHSFTTRNTLDRPGSVKLELIDGPFRKLRGEWTFHSLGDQASKVELHLEFDFSSKLVSMVFGPVFNQIGESMLDAFVRRAEVLHGN